MMYVELIFNVYLKVTTEVDNMIMNNGGNHSVQSK